MSELASESSAPNAGMVVVGAGECGTRAAFALRENGWTGPVTLVGGEAEIPYERPPLSKTGTFTPICDDERLRAVDVTYLPGVHATDVDTDRHTVALDDGRTLAYDQLLLATGATARQLPFTGAPVHLVRTHADAQALRARITPGTRVGVIGGGFIGLELAAGAATLGAGVTVLELGDRLMGRAVPARVATAVAARHVTAGVDVRCGTAVTGLAERPGGIVIGLADGTSVEVDVVVAGVGAVPHTALAERAGLVVDDGILVDATLATSAPDVFAAGDCCRFPHPLYDDRPLRLESWRAAQQHGDTAAAAMLGTPVPYTAVPWFWSDQYDLSLQVAGLASAATDDVVRVRPDGVELWFGLAAQGRLVAAAAVGPGNAVAKDIRLAEMLIAAKTVAAPDVLADPGVVLKSLLRRTPARV
jgi:3-phenylpropionate/trans-cinnamate dioxygenase ferredoxin reductase subunit